MFTTELYLQGGSNGLPKTQENFRNVAVKVKLVVYTLHETEIVVSADVTGVLLKMAGDIVGQLEAMTCWY